MKNKKSILIILIIGLMGLLFALKDDLVSFAYDGGFFGLRSGDILFNGKVLASRKSLDPNDFPVNQIVITYFDEHNVELERQKIDLLFEVNSVGEQFIKPFEITINNSFSNAWVVNDDPYDSGDVHYIRLKPFDYRGPVYSLECDKDKVDYGEEANCVVSVQYYYEINNIDFNLNIPDYTVFEEEKGDYVKDMTKNDDTYNFTLNYIEGLGCEGIYCHSNETVNYNSTLGIYDPFDPVREMVVMRFKVKPEKEQNVTDLDNIKVENINYSDYYGDNDYEVLSATILQETETPEPEPTEPEPEPEVEEPEPQNHEDEEDIKNTTKDTQEVEEPVKEDEKTEVDNPDTSDAIILSILLLLIMSLSVIFVGYREMKAKRS